VPAERGGGCPLRVRLAPAVLLVGGAFLAGCGGSAKVDSGGFTAGDRKAAQKALDTLSKTAVLTAAVNLVATVGVPDACRVHIERRDPLTFKLFMSWIPDEGSLRTHAWLQAVIGPDGVKRGYRFRSGYEDTRAAVEARYGNAFQKPSEPCEVTNVNTFYLVPSEAKVAEQ
jgi:hypothetical protein